MSRLAANIKAIRSAFHLTKTDLAKLLRVSRQQVTRWEAGEAKPQMANLRQVASIFGLTVEELVGDELDLHGRQLHPHWKVELSRWPSADEAVTLGEATDQQLVYELARRMRFLAVQTKDILDQAERFDWQALAARLNACDQDARSIPRDLRPVIELLVLLSDLDREYHVRYSVLAAANRYHSELPGSEHDPDDLDPNTLHARYGGIWSVLARTAGAWRVVRAEEQQRERQQGVGERELLGVIRQCMQDMRKTGVDKAG